MTRIIIDRRLADQLRAADDSVLLVDDSGEPAGFVQREPEERVYVNPIDGSPFTEEKIRRRTQKTTGRPLSAILTDLGAR